MELAGWQAWTTAALTMKAYHAPRKFPTLSSVMPKKGGPKQRQSPEMIKTALKAWGWMKG